MPASRMCQGVSKSGSPTPSEMAAFILATMSKKSRMPDLGRLTTCLAMKRDWSILNSAKDGKLTLPRLQLAEQSRVSGVILRNLHTQGQTHARRPRRDGQ